MQDPFLQEFNAFNRLINEYKKHKSLVVGVDFDGTFHDYHKEGHTYPALINLLRDLKSIGCKIIVWTAYEDHSYVQQYCIDNNIPCDGINIDGIPLPWETRKPFFSVLLDDRAGLREVFAQLNSLVDYVKCPEL